MNQYGNAVLTRSWRRGRGLAPGSELRHRPNPGRHSRRRDLHMLVGGLLAILLASCGKPPQPVSTQPSLTVTVGTLEQVDLVRDIDAAGSVRAWEEMSLGVELTGVRVAEVRVEVGDAVRKGDVLVQLDRRTMEAELRQHEAMVAQALANEVLARANGERARAMRERKLMAAGDIEQMIASERVAEAAVLNARAALASAKLRLEFTSLRAPDDGLISARSVQPGQVIGAGAELLRLIRQGRLEWRAELPESDFLQLAVGARVAVASPAGDVEGRVRALSPSLDAVSRTGIAYVDLPQPGALIAGMFAAGRIHLAATAATMLPSAAIIERDGYRYAFVLDAGDIARQRRVEVGQVSGARIEVLAGITADDRVVVRGAAFLSDGDRVRVVADDASATES
jgi:RND family efflux transporter MFP subunit